MKNILLVLSASFVTVVSAQPTITANVFPLAGDTISLALDTTLAPAGNSGANIAWNFSTLKQDVFVWRIYLNPAGTAYAAKFPNATLCKTDGAGTVYTYWNNSSTQSSYYGFVEPGIYDQNYNTTPVAYYKFPITYGNTFSDSLFATTNPGNIQGSGKYYFAADGWGTLQLPHKSVSNVLRTKSIIYVGDSGINNYSLTTEYAWYQANHKEPLLVISSVYINHVLHKKFVFFDNSSASALSKTEADLVQLYPNPVTNKLTINLVENSNPFTVDIFDIAGKNLQSLDFNQASMPNTIDLSQLSKGVYFVRILADGKVLTRKIIKK